MGHIERRRIVDTIEFVEQLGNLNISSGCLQSALLAMGGANIHLNEVIDFHERMTGVLNINSYLFRQGLALGGSLNFDQPLSLSQTRQILEFPKTIITEANYETNSTKRVAGMLFAFGEYHNEPPHVIGILPRGDMTRNLRRILKRDDTHVVIDTSLKSEPIYPMGTKDIAHNLNAFILNKISVSLHIVTRL